MTTTKTLARSLGVSWRTIQLACKRLGIVPIGRDYILTDPQVKRVTAIMHYKRGRPKAH